MVEYNVNLEGKTVLGSGAAGFIGSNLVKRLFHDVKDIKVIGNRDRNCSEEPESGRGQIRDFGFLVSHDGTDGRTRNYMGRYYK